VAAAMKPQYEYDDLAFERDSGRSRTRPHLVLVGEPRAADRCFPRATRATYWRRRLAVVALALGVLVAAGRAGDLLGGTPLATPERRPSTVSYVVRPGDSLWSVAQRIAPGADPRPVVDALVRGRHGAPLLPGQKIEWKG
jgi:hypothetical protein